MNDLNEIFGYEITVSDSPTECERQYSAFAGANGLVTLLMGSRGSPIVVHGILRSNGTGYADARYGVKNMLANIAELQFNDPADYTFGELTFYSVVWEKPQVIPDRSTGQTYRYNAAGQCLVEFMIVGRCLA